MCLYYNSSNQNNLSVVYIFHFQSEQCLKDHLSSFQPLNWNLFNYQEFLLSRQCHVLSGFLAYPVDRLNLNLIFPNIGCSYREVLKRLIMFCLDSKFIMRCILDQH